MKNNMEKGEHKREMLKCHNKRSKMFAFVYIFRRFLFFFFFYTSVYAEVPSVTVANARRDECPGLFFKEPHTGVSEGLRVIRSSRAR